MIERLITSSLLILIILALRAVFRGRISLRLQYAAWLLVAIRLLMPPLSISSSFSVMNLLNTTESTAVFQRPVQQLPDTQEYNVQDGTDAAPVQSDTPTLAGDSAAVSLSQVLKWVWLCGTVAVGLWLIICNLRFYLRLRKTRRPLEPVLGRRVFVAENISSPCLYGLIRPAIYLSADCAGSSRLHILMHEATHYAHKDHIWSLLRGVLLAVYWFDPLVWIAAAVSRRDCELALSLIHI